MKPVEKPIFVGKLHTPSYSKQVYSIILLILFLDSAATCPQFIGTYVLPCCLNKWTGRIIIARWSSLFLPSQFENGKCRKKMDQRKKHFVLIQQGDHPIYIKMQIFSSSTLDTGGHMTKPPKGKFIITSMFIVANYCFEKQVDVVYSLDPVHGN